jgi:4'-phosphopantetheinyl transferase
LKMKVMDKRTQGTEVDVQRFHPSLPGPEEVHIWRIYLENRADIPFFRTFHALSAAERAQARRYRHPSDADRYMMRRYWVRMILAGYLHTAPELIRITRSPSGKPILKEPPKASPEHEHTKTELSISHSRDITLLAVATCGPVGIDLEFMDTHFNPEGMPRVALSGNERKLFEQVQDSDKLSWFLNLWTAKEACLKFLGSGLLEDPRTCECRQQDDGTYLAYVLKGDEEKEICRVIPVPAGTGYTASLAVPSVFRPAGNHRLSPVTMNHHVQWISLGITTESRSR